MILGVKAIANSGGSDGGTQCGILANGNKLCGQDLVSYCQNFEQGSLDAQTVLSCELVGVDVSSNR